MPNTCKKEDLSPIHGFLKQPSMIDFPGRISGVVFTSGCNFTCGFCHNAALAGPPRPGLPWRRIEQACAKFRQEWVDGMVISGGEPTLLGRDLDLLVDYFKDRGFAVKLDTNGSRPEVLRTVLPRLAYVAMDIKCSLARYPALTGFRRPEKIAESVALLKEAGPDYEFRTTIIEAIHTPAEMLAVAELIRPCPRYVLQTFIPRPDLPDQEMRRQPRTSPDYMKELKGQMEKSGCAGEIIIK